MLKRLLLFLFAFTALLRAQAQEADSVYHALLPIMIDQGEKSRWMSTIEERNAAADSFLTCLANICEYPEAMDFLFTKVTNMSVLQSPDGKLRLFTFMVPQQNYQYKHLGWMIYKDGDLYKSVQLQDNAFGGRTLLYRALPPSQWYGGLYYDIIEKEKEDQTVYFVLGYRSVSPQVQQKFIDAITISEGVVRFGIKAFRIGEFNDIENPAPPYRLMMSYSSEYGAMMKWDNNYGGILMDHVAPPDIKQKGLYMTYGPDFSYDALIWEDENWFLEENISFENDMQTLPPNPNAPMGLSPNDR